MDELDRLRTELEEARETNRRLNRRCQALERGISIMHRHHRALIHELEGHTKRIHAWSDQVARHLSTSEQIHDDEAFEWRRLPKPANSPIDGMKVRVDEALRLIALAEAQPKTLLTEPMLELIQRVARSISGK